jgi:hypothetical protein
MTLRLLYKSSILGDTISWDLRGQLYEHIIDSHFHRKASYKSARAYPLVIIGLTCLKYTYAYYRRRPTLPQALEPLKLLANELIANKPLANELLPNEILPNEILGTSPEECASKFVERLDAICSAGDEENEL